MKKILRKKKTPIVHERITNETVAEHRERILAGGRRFKYPVQYARHRLVFNTIIISVIALIIFIIFVWWQLYSVQSTSTFFYRMTRALPLPVASVDGEQVPYSYYLMNYRSQAHYLTVKEGVDLGAPDSKRQVEFIKRKAMRDAQSDVYAEKIAKQKDISVSDKDVDDAILRQRRSRDGVASEQTYDAIVLDHFGWTPQEAREVTRRKLLQQRVAYAVDDVAEGQRKAVEEHLRKNVEFDAIAKEVGGNGAAKVTSAITPLVPRSNQDDGLALRASTLKKGEVSPIFKSTSGDGYYVVKLLDADNNSRISYAFIKIPLTVFSSRLDMLQEQHKISEYITIPEAKPQSL